MIYRIFLCSLIFIIFYKTTGQSITPSLPKKVNPKDIYLFYLHGKIVEEQGLNAISKDYGKFEYQKILDTLRTAGFNVISEVRPKNTDPELYADKVVAQIDSLLKKNVRPENITVLGASKGAGISIIVSSKLKNMKVKFIFMGICGDDYDYTQDMFKVCGRILSIYEKTDPFGGSCKKLFISGGDCVEKFKEIELNLGVGHGFLYKPYKEWIIPAIEWAKK